MRLSNHALSPLSVLHLISHMSDSLLFYQFWVIIIMEKWDKKRFVLNKVLGKCVFLFIIVIFRISAGMTSIPVVYYKVRNTSSVL